MLSFLPHSVRGILSILVMATSTIILCPIVVFIALIKLLIPNHIVRRELTEILIRLANSWIAINNLLLELMHKIEWDIQGAEQLRSHDWYFVTCNHQSWSDIPIVQKVLTKRIPMLKFFLKQELIWVPFIGLAWWALDFPFMKRYSQEELLRNPELKGKDLETTRKACEKFRYTPVTVFNFLEGTRLTPEKQLAQSSPYTHLLKPKAGGAGFVLGAMGDMLHTLVNITIFYPGEKGFFRLFSGRVKKVVVRIEVVTIPPQFLGKDYLNDEDFRAEFQQWLGDLWQRKDHLLQYLRDQEAQKKQL